MDLGTSVRFDHQLLAVEAEHHVHCMLELTAPPAPADRIRKPLHLALVIDRSGSMAGDKLRTAAECAAYLARRLSPTDELAIVTYDDQVRLELALSPVGEHATAPERALRGLTAGGMTNLSAVAEGSTAARRAGRHGPKKVLLLRRPATAASPTSPPWCRWRTRPATTASAPPRSGSVTGSTRTS